MGGRHQPTEGADSPPDDPPMQELPRPSISMVEAYVRQNMPPTSDEADIKREVSMVLMADVLGRAIHSIRVPGGLLDMPMCTRVNRHGVVENVPYAYDDKRPDGYACNCEAIALVLVQMIAAAETVEDVKASPSVTVLPAEWDA